LKTILLLNTGTPETYDVKDVEDFIGQMLSDPLLTDLPKPISKFLATKIIAPKSAPKSAEKYKLIWHDEYNGISPLMYYMKSIVAKTAQIIDANVMFAMRYGRQNINNAMLQLSHTHNSDDEVIAIPLFPHYAKSSYGSAVKELKRAYVDHSCKFALHIAEPFYDHPEYIDALAKDISPHIHSVDKLVLVYHSLPMNHINEGEKRGKPFDYVAQIEDTNRLLCERLDISNDKTITLYSSQRRGNWLKPYLNHAIAELPKQGFKRVVITSPGFICDNLETLYDIDIEARALFMEAGGEEFVFIPSLNDSFSEFVISQYL
jgi:ferrochelatase